MDHEMQQSFVLGWACMLIGLLGGAASACKAMEFLEAQLAMAVRLPILRSAMIRENMCQHVSGVACKRQTSASDDRVRQQTLSLYFYVVKNQSTMYEYIHVIIVVCCMQHPTLSG